MVENIKENRQLEQYFFTENVLRNLVDTLEYEDDIFCLCTPALADAFYRLKERTVTCLDIDDRFSYLPGYVKYDVLNPKPLDIKPKVIIVDPPFFGINLIDLYKCVDVLSYGDKSTRIIFAFVQREDRGLFGVFKSYNLKATKFKLEYQTVDPTKWSNYGLYSNYEFSKIKFYKKK
jgi:hypothetical protein